MRQKLGLFNEEGSDIELINELLVLMQKNKADYTLTFRHLSSDAILKDAIFKDASFKVWYKNWLHCIQKQKEGGSIAFKNKKKVKRHQGSRC
ncbi:MAG: hypothetical protein RIQ76_980 [Pseudomonadota bacterium]